MAKVSMKQREAKREKMVAKFAAKRDALREIMKSPTSSFEEKMEAQTKLQKMPRNSSASRLRNRCNVTGRPHGYLRKFGLSRIKLREHTMNGDVPGLHKASW